MYSLRLIYKKPFEGNYEEFVVATHIRIKDDVISFFVPQEMSKEPVDFNINDFQYIFVNHYIIYTIDELVECYMQDASISNDYDNIMSIFKLIDILFSKKEMEIFNSLSDSYIDDKKEKKHKQKKDKNINNENDDNKEQESETENKENVMDEKNNAVNKTVTGEEAYKQKYSNNIEKETT